MVFDEIPQQDQALIGFKCFVLRHRGLIPMPKPGIDFAKLICDGILIEVPFC